MNQFVLVEETRQRPPPCYLHPETANWRGYRVRVDGGCGCPEGLLWLPLGTAPEDVAEVLSVMLDVGALNTDRPPLAEAAATLREREHHALRNELFANELFALRNELFALTVRTDLAKEEVARRRDELIWRLTHTQEILARSQALVRRSRERHRVR